MIDFRDWRVVPTYHPSFALRAPDEESRHAASAAIFAASRRAGELAIGRPAKSKR